MVVNLRKDHTFSLNYGVNGGVLEIIEPVHYKLERFEFEEYTLIPLT